MLRPITPSDIPQLCAIELATQKFPWSQEIFEKCLQVQNHSYVITTPENQILGFILSFIQLNECHILNLAVHPNHQRQHYGTQLLTQFLTDAKQIGATIAYLEVRHSNQAAIALYEKLGFTKIGERKAYYTSPEGNEDAWVFMKHL